MKQLRVHPDERQVRRNVEADGVSLKLAFELVRSSGHCFSQIHGLHVKLQAAGLNPYRGLRAPTPRPWPGVHRSDRPL